MAMGVFKKSLKHTFLLVLLMAPFGDLLGSEEPLKFLHVSAKETVDIPASIAELAVGISIEDVSASAVQTRLKADNNKLIDYLKRIKVNDLKTQRYQIHPKYSFKDNVKKRIGYEGSTRVNFQIPMADVGRVLDELLKAGANELVSIQFTASQEELQKAQDEALKNASQKALAKGKRVLEDLKLKFNEISEVTVGQRESRLPRPMGIASFQSKSDRVSIEAGDVSVEAEISLKLSYE